MTTYFRKLGHHRWEYGYEYSGRLVRAGLSRTRHKANDMATQLHIPATVIPAQLSSKILLKINLAFQNQIEYNKT